MVENQLTAPVEEVQQTRLAVWTLEEIFLVDLDHRQPATFSIEPVSRTRRLLFFDEQFLASNKPLFS